MRVRTVVAVLACLVTGAHSAIAQELAPYEIEATGTEYEIRLGPEQKSLKTISVYFVSTGNVSHAAMITLSGPVGIKGIAQGAFLGHKKPLAALKKESSLQRYAIRTYSSTKEAESFTTASNYDPIYGYASPWFHLSKNACGTKRDKYVAQIKLDLKGIDRALYDQTFSIKLSVKMSKFQGKPVASIKPSSDGQYHGEPILLMNTVGYGGEYVNKVTWKKGKIVATTRLPVVKYVGYMGYGLSLTRIKDVLHGGKHTWELSNGGDIYGVCLEAVRKRQRVNGYPGS